VAGLSIYGAEAELINQAEKYLVPIPPGLDPKQATALVLDWNTAFGMVMHAAEVKAGQMVFVHGLSGAVGHALLTLSKLQGARVFGTASSEKPFGLDRLGSDSFCLLRQKLDQHDAERGRSKRRL
jgi:NADPH:quinone reductase-like Zn-dependent oxidoreductase